MPLGEPVLLCYSRHSNNQSNVLKHYSHIFAVKLFTKSKKRRNTGIPQPDSAHHLITLNQTENDMLFTINTFYYKYIP